MAKIKSYPDINQCKKLTEILPIESADMHYVRVYFEGKQSDWFVRLGRPVKSDDIIPCWSLAALLSVLPLSIDDELDCRDYELEINMIDKMPRYIRLGDIYHSQFPYNFEKDTLLDNVVESIIWLNDNNYFKV